MNKGKVITLSILFSLVVISLVSGGTYAYFSAVSRSEQNDIIGKTYNFSAELDVTREKSGNLIPVMDNLMVSSLNSQNPCVDSRQEGYSLCSIYKVRLTNSGEAAVMTGGIITSSSTYTTSNLKYQLFTLNNSTYTAASDSSSVSNVATTLNSFTLNSSNMSFSLADGTSSTVISDYYLVIWLSDDGTNQLADRDKTFTGAIQFVSTNGATIQSTFITV